MTTLPDGFPEVERQSGAVQARLTDTGLDYVHDNMSSIVGMLLEEDGPLQFPIPPTCSGSQKVCCYVPYGSCQLIFDIEERAGDSHRVEIDPLGGNQVELTLRARVRTTDWLPVHARGPLGGEVSCWVYIDSRRAGPPWITIRSVMELFDDPATGTTRGQIISTSLAGVSAGDVAIDGGFLCGFGDPNDGAVSMNAQLRSRIPGEIEDLLCSKCESDSDCAPQGTCGDDGVCALDNGECMVNLGTQGRIAAADAFGSLVNDHADAIDLYLSVGGGVQTDGDGLQLDVLTGIKASNGTAPHECVPTLPQPEMPAVASSLVLASNTHPRTGEAYDLGLGIHKSFLERAAWAAHQAGFLCLDVGASRVPLLQADTLSILAPSLIDLTHGDSAPIFLRVRPQTVPTIAFGAGTLTDNGSGEAQIDEPLITLGMKDLEIDFYAWVDQRYVRILTLRADLTVPIGLDVDGQGQVVPVLGDLAESFDEIRVVNSGVLAESPEQIAEVFPAVLSVALPALSDGLGGGFEVPAFGGMTLELDRSSFSGIDDDSMLGIFGNLAPATTKLRRGASTRVNLTRVHEDRPAITLALDGDPINAGADLEWSVRIDNGYWTPYSRAPEITLDRQAFRLVGKHTVEVRAREIGAPTTTGQPELIEVEIKAKPRLGAVRPLDFHGTPNESGCDCSTSGERGNCGILFLVGVVALGLGRRRRLVGAGLVLLIATLASCGSDPGGDNGDDDLDPTVVNPGPTGRWASMAADGERAVLVAYEQEFGDLVFATITDEGEPRFEVIDGAPAEPVVLDPNGYRDGVNAAGEDVGGYTSTVIAAGEVMVAYQDRDRAAVRFIREDGGAWSAHDVDVPAGEDEFLGRFNTLAIDSAGNPAIAYMVAAHIPGEPAEEGAEEAPGTIHGELRIARASSPAPAGPEDWTITVLDAVDVPFNPDFEDVPRGTGAYASAAALADGRLAVVYYRQASGDLMLAVEDAEAETGWARVELDAGAETVRGAWSDIAVDGDGVAHIVYQDAVDDRLLYRTWTADADAGPAEIIDDGRREGDRPHSVGGGAQIFLVAGTPVVAYQDGTLSDLLWSARDAEGSWTRQPLLEGAIGYGFHVASASVGNMAWVSSYVYDQASWPPGHTEVRAIAP